MIDVVELFESYRLQLNGLSLRVLSARNRMRVGKALEHAVEAAVLLYDVNVVSILPAPVPASTRTAASPCMYGSEGGALEEQPASAATKTNVIKCFVMVYPDPLCDPELVEG